ncbi:MAG: hypothetical protein IKT40_08895 [Bacilli bacterium]|nr:hypothetical protein [Bacilli bacterium]
MDFDKIISEQIKKYISENVFDEKKMSNKDAVKMKIKNRDGIQVSKSDEDRLRSLLKTNLFNIAAVAKRVYPDHTDEGAQSQLRKKIMGEKSDSGSEYHLNQREAEAIRRILDEVGNAMM